MVATLGPSAEEFGWASLRRRFSLPAPRRGGAIQPIEVLFPLVGPSGPKGNLILVDPSLRVLSRARQNGLMALASQVAVTLASVRLQEELTLSLVDARYRSVVLSTSDLITIIGRDGRIRYQAPSVTPILGYRQPELIGKEFATLLHPEDLLRARRYVAELSAAGGTGTPIKWRLCHQDGSWRQVETIGTNLLHDPHIDGIILTSRDIGDRKRLEQQLLDPAARDPLTGLANRTTFGEYLARVLDANRFPTLGAAVLFLDLDNFKTINDKLRHDSGDRLLRDLADRLRSCLRPDDMAARLGGDEFAILLDTDSRADLVPRVAERLPAALRAPFLLARQHITIGVSIGIAVAATREDTPGTLLHMAD